jgi:hypothetical protein
MTQFPHRYTTLPGHDPSKVRQITCPALSALLAEKAPLVTQLSLASQQLRGMLDAGELDALPSDTRMQIVGLSIFLAGAAARVPEATGNGSK